MARGSLLEDPLEIQMIDERESLASPDDTERLMNQSSPRIRQRCLLMDLFPNLDVPVREVDEVLPAIVTVQAEVNLNEGTPFRTFRLADQMQASFLRSSIRFLGIARDAGTDNILPSRWTTVIAGNHVVKIQILAIKNASAILTSVLVALENIMPGKFNFLFRKTIKDDQQDNPGHADLE